MPDTPEIDFDGSVEIPKWVAYAIESQVADVCFTVATKSRPDAEVTKYELKECAKRLAWVRALIREHAKIKTQYWYDAPAQTTNDDKKG